MLKGKTFLDLNTPKTGTCRECVHRERHACNSKTIQYCGIRTSYRTFNGKLKIKCKNKACILFEKDTRFNNTTTNSSCNNETEARDE